MLSFYALKFIEKILWERFCVCVWGGGGVWVCVCVCFVCLFVCLFVLFVFVLFSNFGRNRNDAK